MEESKKVRVACTIQNGYELRLYKEGYDDGTGARPRVPDGDAVILKGPDATQSGANAMASMPAVVTEVDEPFITKWLVQNEQNPFVKRGCILVLPARDKAAAPVASPLHPAPAPESGSVAIEGAAASTSSVPEAKENPTP